MLGFWSGGLPPNWGPAQPVRACAPSMYNKRWRLKAGNLQLSFAPSPDYYLRHFCPDSRCRLLQSLPPRLPTPSRWGYRCPEGASTQDERREKPWAWPTPLRLSVKLPSTTLAVVTFWMLCCLPRTSLTALLAACVPTRRRDIPASYVYVRVSFRSRWCPQRHGLIHDLPLLQNCLPPSLMDIIRRVCSGRTLQHRDLQGDSTQPHREAKYVGSIGQKRLDAQRGPPASGG